MNCQGWRTPFLVYNLKVHGNLSVLNNKIYDEKKERYLIGFIVNVYVIQSQIEDSFCYSR